MKIVELEFGRNGAHIVAFTRDKDGKLVRQNIKHKHYIYEEDINGTHTTIMGQKVSQKKFNKFWDVKTYLKTHEKSTYEDDVGYIKRFLIDHGEQLETHGQPRVFFYDIETTGFSSQHMEIISIVGYDTFEEKYYEFIWKPGSDECNSERKMLLEFCKVIKDVDPDILSGWNSDRFDLPFIIDRCDILGIPTSILSRLNQKVEPYHSNDGYVYPIRGRVNIDYLKAYKKMHYGELDSYSLESVAQHELGAGKIETDELPGTLWEQGRDDELLAYNKRDVEVMVELDQKLRIIEFLDAVSTLASCSLEDTLFNSRIVDSYILKYTTQQGIVLPSRRFNNKRRDYTGAKVLDPIVGVHDNVGIFDLASLYPSIIITWNLSPETVNSDKDDSWNQPKGLVPTLLEDLFTLRQQYRDEGRDNDQRVVKEIMNSFYGVMALPTFRLYEQKVASETTKHGRDIIEYTKRIAEEASYTVIYGDTDSVFVSGISDITAAESLEHTINNAYDDYISDCGIDNHRLRIEFEDFATRAIMVKKKRYAMKLDDGSYKIAGFQMKRSDTPPLAKEMQEKIIHMILEGSSKQEAYNYYDLTRAYILDGNMNGVIGIPRKFTKSLDKYASNYAIDAAKYSNEHLGKHFGAGDKAVIYHVKRVDIDKELTNSIALEYGDPVPDGYSIDTKKHWERISKSIDTLLGDFMPKTKQKSLADFL